ncbi:uncharacterized protein ACBT44_005920 isoform 1-T1 [Syngnathus typhle]
MTDPNTPLISTEPQSQSEETQGTDPSEQQDSVQLRRSQRVKTLTEKGREMQDEKIKGLQQRFNYNYEKWRTHAKASKVPLSQPGPSNKDILEDITGDVRGLCADVTKVFDELRKLTPPDQETRRRADLCVEISGFLVNKATCRLEGREEQDWPEAGSLFQTTSSKSSSFNMTKNSSEHSHRSSVKHQEAAAEAAASQAVLKILEEQQMEQQEIERLEVEVRKRAVEQETLIRQKRLEREAEEIRLRMQREADEAKFKAQQEEEYAALQRTLDEKKRKVQHLEKVKDLKAAQARMQVYDQMSVAEVQRVDVTKINTEIRDVEHVSFPSLLEQVSPQAAGTPKGDGTSDLVKVLASALSASRIPVPEPTVFSGDPLSYSDWKLSFQTLIDQKNIPNKEKIFYLRRYVSGPAKRAIEGYFLLGTESAHAAAWKILDERYGNPFTIAKAFRDKLHAWPKMTSRDSFELRDFADFLRSCEAATAHIKSLEILNDCNENRKILSKLPDWLAASWNRKVVEIEEQTNQFPTFSQFVEFLTREAKIACNPVTSLQSLKQCEFNKSDKLKFTKQKEIGVKTLMTTSQEKTQLVCVFCKKPKHSLHKCRSFLEKAVSDRISFIKSERLCFGCLKPGHLSKSCTNRNICERCSKGHPTCLHEDRVKDKEEQKQPLAKPNSSNERSSQSDRAQEQVTAMATTNRVASQENNTLTAAIIPVWLSSSTKHKEVLVYALLDSQSDTTFVLSEVAKLLDTNQEPVKLELSTMSSQTTVVQSNRLQDLKVRGLNSSKEITLPPTYTREFIPANKAHIPTNETAKAWPHLEHLQPEIAPLQDCEVGLLIGYNCSQALLPREIVSGKEGEPYAQRTDLGWSIVGQTNPCLNYGDAIGISHRIIVKKVIPELKPSLKLQNKVHYVNRTTVKDVTPSDVIKALEGDFSERALDANLVPHEELEEEKDIKRSLRKKTVHLKPSQKVHEEPKPSEDQEKRKPPKEVLEIPQKKQVDESLGEDKDIQKPSQEDESKPSEMKEEKKPPKEEKPEDVISREPEKPSKQKPKEPFKDVMKPSKKEPKKLSKVVKVTTRENTIDTSKVVKEVKKNPKEKPAPNADVSKKPFRFLRVTKKQTAPVLKKEHVNVTKEKVPKVKAKPEPLGKENEVKKPQKEVKKEDTEVKVTSKEVTKPQKQDKEVKVPPKEAKKLPKKLKELPSHEKEVRKPKEEEKSVKEVTKDELKVKEDKGVLSKPPKEQKLEEAEKPTSKKLPRKIRTIKEVQEKPPKEGKEDKRRPREDVEKALKRERLKEVEKPFKEANMSSVVLQETKKPLEGGSEVKDKRTSLKRFFTIHKEVTEAKKVTKDEKEGKTPPEKVLFFRRTSKDALKKTHRELKKETEVKKPPEEEIKKHLKEDLQKQETRDSKSTIVQPPPGEFMKEDLYLQKRWRRVQYLANEFWIRWRKEYLLNLQPRQKWTAHRRNLKVNDVVLLKEDMAPRNEWKLAKVTDVYPGTDNKVRKVRLLVSERTHDKHSKLVTKTVSLERPIHKVIVLLEAD